MINQLINPVYWKTVIFKLDDRIKNHFDKQKPFLDY